MLDRAKSLLSRHASATPGQSIFWRLLGIDRSLHGLTHRGSPQPMGKGKIIAREPPLRIGISANAWENIPCAGINVNGHG
jgi:hypothetical protein